jgi:polysaccharide biosynthesis transport protein
MNDKINGSLPQTSGITRDDIFYILSRHKWKIVTISAIAILGAGLVYFLWPLPYRSEARLLIKYIVDTKSPGQMGTSNSKVSSPDDRGETILNTELEVLGSFDIAMEVAKSVGPSNILAKVGGGNDVAMAAGVIRKGLSLDAPKRSSAIHLVFEHKDPTILQPVLNALIQEYYKKHLEIHRDVGQFGDFLTQQTDQLHSRLLQTEEALRAAKTNAGVISVEDTKKVYGEQIARIQDSILQAEAELAERQAAAAEMAKLTHSEMPVLTNATAAVTNDAAVPSEKLAEYKRLSNLIDRLSNRQQELSVQFTPENSWVKQVSEQIAENEKLREKLEAAYPSLAGIKTSLPRSATDSRGNTQIDLTAGLQRKIKILTAQLDDIQKAAAKMYASEGSISDLQRKYYLQETQYNYFSMSLEQSRIDEALGASRVSNISQIQSPTPPGRDYVKLQKASLGILGGGIAFAIGLAFLIELYLDQSIKRPIEVENRLGVPLFISIPRVNLSTPRKGLTAGKTPLLASPSMQKSGADHAGSSDLPGSSNGAEKTVLIPSTNGANGHQLAPWDPRYVLRPFCQALRDNIITFFEVNNLTHKPKLVAVTSCSNGAGVSTIAAGLAASLSETGEGNVLLVNMNQTEGAVQQFYKGDLACDLDDALEGGLKRDQALVQSNLYIANENHNADSFPVILPKRFKSLIPRLRASDYDYIIFDMPEVSQITSTQRLARFMDMVLMVVESEKTNRDTAKRVTSLLTGTKTNVAVVLNKTRDKIPARLQQGA